MNANRGLVSRYPHTEGIADTAEGYIATQGWHIGCLWCDWQTVQRTKADALNAYRQHERTRLNEEFEEALDAQERAKKIDARGSSQVSAPARMPSREH